MKFSKFFSMREIEQIHEASLKILVEVGVLVRNEKARRIFSRHGCKIDSDTKIVKFPSGIIEEFQAGFSSSFTFRGRDPQFDRTIPDDSPVMITASSAPNIIDPRTGEERLATSTDIANIAFLINELPGYDVFSISTLADDAPEGMVSLSRFYPALKNCLKPIKGTAANLKELMSVLELGYLVAGGEDAYKKRPIITHHYCPMISPLTMDVESTDSIIYLVGKGFPVYGTIAPNAGMTSPMTLMGTLALGNAEFLALNVFIQMIRPEAPSIYSVLSTVSDMRTADFVSGGIETGIMQMAHTQMAQYYNIPSGGYVGLTNSHTGDAQSGYETGMSSTAALLCGADIFSEGGLISGLMSFDFGKAVIDNEISLMLKRLNRGIEFNEDNIALEVIRETGPGGNYVTHPHTIKNLRNGTYLPEIANRMMRAVWEDEGRLDAHTRALKQADEILSNDNPAVFSKEQDSLIRERFSGLVSGDVQWKG
ncbi:MAG: trimethylamine methyltransferase family protein [Desulfobacterales bacterium]